MTRVNKDELIKRLEEAKQELSSSLLKYVGKVPKIASTVEKVKHELDNMLMDLKELPRICVIGNTGIGKSSFINHLLNAKVAATNAVWSETTFSKSYKYPNVDNPVCEVIDTRGLGEIFKSEESEKQLFNDLTQLRPHLIIFVTDIITRANIDRNLKFLKQVIDYCQLQYKREVGCLILANRADGISPTSYKLDNIIDYHNISNNPIDDEDLLKLKITNIQEKLNQLNFILEKEDLNIGRNDNYKIKILPMSLRWNEEDILFWNKDEILKELFNQSPNNVLLSFAEMFANSNKTNQLLDDIADILINDFSNLSRIIGATPIPVSDAVLLVPLQLFMISIIECLRLHNTKISAEAFMGLLAGPLTLGGKAVANYLLKQIPGLGNVINAEVAHAFTYGLGNAAKAYYIDGMNENLIKDHFINIVKDESIKDKLNNK